PLADDETRQAGGDGETVDPRIARRLNLEEARDPVDVPQDEMPGEAISPRQGSLQVHRVVWPKSRERRSLERFLREVGDQPPPLPAGGQGRPPNPRCSPPERSGGSRGTDRPSSARRPRGARSNGLGPIPPRCR